MAEERTGPRPAEAAMTALLSNRQLHRLERLRLNARRRFTDKMRGEHLAGRGGQSTDFSDYRDYSPGDDVRFVDWNIFARLNRPYLKLYHLEEVMHLAILVDASSSMLFEDKLTRACQLAAAFGIMGLLGNERVSVYVFNAPDHAPQQLPPCMGRAGLANLFAFLESVDGGGDAPLEAGIERMLRYHVGKGVALVLSDFLTFGDVRTALNRLYSRGLEVFGVQVLGPAELDPDLSGDVRLVDSELARTLDISSAGALLSLYHEYLEANERELASLCRQRAGRFVRVDASADLDWVLFDQLRRRGWVR